MTNSLTPKQKSALDRSLHNPALLRVLFDKVRGVKWFPEFVAAGLAKPESIPAPIVDAQKGTTRIPIWPITTYLVNVADELRLPASEPIARDILRFIRETTEFARANGLANFKVWHDFATVMLRIPPTLLVDTDAELVDYWLDDPYDRGLVAEVVGEGWLPELLASGENRSRQIALNLMGSIYRVRDSDAGRDSDRDERARLRLEVWYAKKISTKVAPLAGRHLGLLAVEILESSLKRILESNNSDRWSSIWRPAIEPNAQNVLGDRAEHVVIDALRETWVSAISSGNTRAKEHVETVLRGEIDTLKRIAIHVVDSTFPALANLISLLADQKFLASNFRHEYWTLLNNRFLEFSELDRSRVLACIDEHVLEKGSVDELAGVYRRAVWLSAIRDKSAELEKSYQDCVSKVGEPDHPSFSSYMTSGWVEPKSPIRVDELLALSPTDLLQELENYPFSDARNRADNAEGLSKTLKAAIKAASHEFLSRLDDLDNAEFGYVAAILDGYSEQQTADSSSQWGELWPKLLGFMERTTSRIPFPVSDIEMPERANWVTATISRMLDAGARSDQRYTLPTELLPQAERIISTLVERTEGRLSKVDSEAVTTTINSPLGCALDAMFALALRACRDAKQDPERHRLAWERFKPQFDEQLARAQGGAFEFIVLIASYVPQMLFLSRQWLFDSWDLIFGLGNQIRWISAMQGYAHVSTIYPDVYARLKSSGAFIAALDDERVKDRVDQKIIQNICVAYMHGDEALSDDQGLMRELVKRAKASELGHAIWFIWSMSRNGDADVERIMSLWQAIASGLDLQREEHRKIAGHLCQWIAFVTVVNEGNIQLIEMAVENVESVHGAYELMPNLARISETQPMEAARIWMAALRGSVPSYPKEAVDGTLLNIARSGPAGVRAAKGIVDKYILVGSVGMNELLAEYRN